ncbi:MAG: hypothetical protein ABR502_08700 [Chitinophagaceae bacterium]
MYQKIEEDLRNPESDPGYIRNLQGIKTKQAEAFRKTKEGGSSAWPEFEKFVSDFERVLTETLRAEN